MSDEEDYMSENLINNIDDIKPGLLKSKDKRINELYKKSEDLNLKRKKGYLENLNREKKLSEPISQENKGYKILKKMGYIEEKGIGKQFKKVEPIPLNIKTNKCGFGKDFKLRHNIKTKISDSITSNYVLKNKEKLIMRNLIKNINEGGKILANLENKHFEEEELNDSNKEDDEEDCNEDINVLNCKFQLLNEKLRASHYYCFWCGAKYDDNEDLYLNCPGPNEDDH